MENNFLSDYPSPADLKRHFGEIIFPEYRENNSHIHTPFSFSAFSDLDTMFSLAGKENIALLGINDFYVTDGYDAFNNGCLINRIFPLFNIEFIGLMKDEQQSGIRINDPNNPGRIYFCGKGLDYPFHLGKKLCQELKMIKLETQSQLCKMVLKLNSIISTVSPGLKLSFDDIKKDFTSGLVRERHIAKALRVIAEKNYPSEEARLQFIESLYGGKKSKAGLSDPAALENEIRSNLLKAGGAAFVEEDERSFFNLTKIIEIIIDAGGIPCYPVLLDDPSGKYTEFEEDPEKLFASLSKLGVGCIELIPGRNDLLILQKFVEYFDNKGFVVLFGTEHNTPEMIPITVRARAGKPIDEQLKIIAWKGACVVAAHQYLNAQGMTGFIDQEGKARISEKRTFELLGQMVIEYFLNNK
jgi:hypothetical protein